MSRVQGTREMFARPDDRCWCGQTLRAAVGSHYRICDGCGTAGLVERLPSGHFAVSDDERDFYARRYWFEYQQARGYPDIESRSRSDLSERCVYWLKAMLEFVTPPGRTLEIGCGHGGFVRLLRDLGFDAEGTELSAWVVDFARRAFAIPLLHGDLESLDLTPGYRCILSFDVLEHVEDPLNFARRCAELLAPDGVLLLQTPWYRGEGPDWRMFQPDEHVFLFTERAMRLLLTRAGLPHTVLRQSLYPHDMWVAASPQPLRALPCDGTRAGAWRLPAAFRALLDLRTELESANRDRAARLDQVHELTRRVHESEMEAATHRAQIEELTERVRLGEAVASTRLVQIEELTHRVRHAETEADARLVQIEELTQRVRHAETEADARLVQIEELTQRVRHAETEADARLVQIGELTQGVQRSQADGEARLTQIHELTRRVRAVEAEGEERLAQIHELTRRLQESTTREATTSADAAALTERLRESEAQVAAQLTQLEAVTRAVKKAKADGAARLARIGELTRLVQESESERSASARRLAELEAELERRLARIVDADVERGSRSSH